MYSTEANARTPLLSLPGEIRNMIWGHVVSGKVVTRSPRHEFPILRVCSQIHHEAIIFSCKKNVFRWKLSDLGFSSSFNAMSNLQREAVQSVELCAKYHRLERSSCDDVRDALESFPNARYVKLVCRDAELENLMAVKRTVHKANGKLNLLACYIQCNRPEIELSVQWFKAEDIDKKKLLREYVRPFLSSGTTDQINRKQREANCRKKSNQTGACESGSTSGLGTMSTTPVGLHTEVSTTRHLGDLYRYSSL